MKTIKSQGFVLTKYGEPETAFQLQDIDLQYSDEQILVKVSAFGLNYADVMARLGKYQDAPPLPTTIGYEVVGNIEAVGAKIDSNLIGKRVLAFSQFGAYARHAIIEKEAFVVLEEHVPDEDALALCTQYVTAYYMSMYQSVVRSHDIVLIHAAAGGVGLGLVQMCKNAGATVLAKIGDDKKAATLKVLGVDHIINYNQVDYEKEVRRILGNKYLTYSFNPVGGLTFKKDMNLLGPLGKIVIFGGSSLTNGKYGILSQVNFVLQMGFPIPAFLMMQSKSILGVNMLHVALEYPSILHTCMEEVQKLYHQGALKAFIGKVYDSNHLADAHHFLASGKSSGKLVVHW